MNKINPNQSKESTPTLKKKRRFIFGDKSPKTYTKNQLQDCESQQSLDQYQHGDRSIQLTIYFASGGNVIEYSRFDRSTGDRKYSLHVIPSDQSIGSTIEKIITYESLK